MSYSICGNKILQALEYEEEEESIELGFVLKSYKGSKAEREAAGREARKHGAKASALSQKNADPL